MAQGLNVERLVNVTVNLSPLAAARRGFGTLLVAGDSNVIDGKERARVYTSIESVALDFGTSAPEYLAAALYFSQSPRPKQIMIGRFLRTATGGMLKGGILTAAEQTLSNFTAITTGSFKLTLNGGAATDITNVNLSTATSLSQVATLITAKLTGGATCTWDGQRFIITSTTTGITSAVAALQAAASGTDISPLLKMNAALASSIVPGYAAETPTACAIALADARADWYGLMFASSTMPTAGELVAVAAAIEAMTTSRIFGVVETDTRVLDSTYTTDLASQLKVLLYKRSFVVYSANKYAVASVFGRAFSVNFAANRSTITLMYKQMPGIVAENLTETQAQVLEAKRCNVFAAYQNDTAIFQNGVMSGPAYLDEIHGLDWFVDALQVAEYNLLYQSTTKIPQTDAGQNQLVNVASGVCAEAVNNGLVAPGTWNADGFGQLGRGDYLSEGYYIYTAPMATQDQSIREQRVAPPLQIALKLAGAIHKIDAIVNVNR